MHNLPSESQMKILFIKYFTANASLLLFFILHTGTYAFNKILTFQQTLFNPNVLIIDSVWLYGSRSSRIKCLQIQLF